MDFQDSQLTVIGNPLTTRPFIYSVLRDGHIRLVHLNVGTRNDALSIQVQENVELQTAPVYEALSYTWGDSKKECSISCGSESIEITTNLAAALLQLRSPDKPRALWIDQICINQDDVEERSKQVALMRKIYSEAENVVIWLGKEGPDDEMAFRFVPVLLSRLPPLSTSHGGVARRGLVSRELLPIAGSPAWIALSRIFSRPYFRRSWIIQEVALARHAVVHCGPHVIDWDLLAAASSYQMGQLPSDAENAHDAVAAIMEFHRNDHGRGNNIVDALFMSYRFNCTDPRDKVFAMLGLAQALVLQPSYSARVEDVYLTTTRFLILESGNLDILCCVSHPKTIATLPSWVPDWQAQVAVHRKLGKSTVRAPDAPRQQVRYSDNSRTLTVEGWSVASIATVANVFTRDDSGVLIGWNEFFEKTIHSDGRSSSELYRRTLLAGERLPGITSDEELHSAYEAWENLLTRRLGGYKPLTNLPDENDKGTEFDRAMTETCAGRRLFATAQHNLGLAPSEARAGDVVCFLGINSTPFILRPRGNYFEFVGESYAHDFVEQGHPLRQLTRQEKKRELRIGEHEITDFRNNVSRISVSELTRHIRYLLHPS